MKKNVYIVFIYNMDEKRGYHHGMVWTSKESAKEYANYCNEQYLKSGTNKIAYVETLQVID